MTREEIQEVAKRLDDIITAMRASLTDDSPEPQKRAYAHLRAALGLLLDELPKQP